MSDIMEEKKPAEDLGAHITLRAKGQDGNEVTFRIKRSTQLKKLMKAYCDQQSVKPNSIAFLYDGCRVIPEKTPDELNMEDGDEIDVMPTYLQPEEGSGFKMVPTFGCNKPWLTSSTPPSTQIPLRLDTAQRQYQPNPLFTPVQLQQTGFYPTNLSPCPTTNPSTYHTNLSPFRAQGAYNEFNLPPETPIPEAQLKPPQTQAQPQPQPQPQPETPKNSKRKNLINPSSSTPAHDGPAPAQPWTSEEEVVLAKAWIDMSEDNQIGNPQKRNFWKRILAYFYTEMGRGEYRSHHQLNSKWRDLNKKLSNFNAIYNNLIDQRSGEAEADILNAAHFQYQSKNNGKAFTHEKAWEVLRNSSKWVALPPKNPPTSGPKRTKTSDSNTYTTSSDDHCQSDLNNNDEEFEVEERQRIGRQKGKRPSPSSMLLDPKEEKFDRLVAHFIKFNATNEHHLAEMREMQREKLRLKQEERRDKDLKFFVTPHDHLTGSQLRAILAVKEEIKKKYGWE